MAWIELHQSLPRHKKTLRLARLLKVSRREAWALVAELWLWAVDNAPTGGPLFAEDIADAVEWDGDALDLAEALKSAGWVDQASKNDLASGWMIHDWVEYIQPLLDSREKNKQRVTKWRAERKNSVTNDVRNADVTRNTTHNEQSNERETNALRMPLPNRTVPNLTKPNTTGPEGPAFGPVGELSHEKQNRGGTDAANVTTAAGAGAEARSGSDAEGNKPQAKAPGEVNRSPAAGADVRGSRQPAAQSGTGLQQQAKPADPAANRPGVHVEARTAKPAGVKTDRQAFVENWSAFFYALRLHFGKDGDTYARRWFSYAQPRGYCHAQREFTRLILACFLDARETPIDANGDAIKDVVSYVIGWDQKRQDNRQERPPRRVHVQKAQELLGMADNALQKNGTRHESFMNDLVKAWTEYAKPKSAGVVA